MERATAGDVMIALIQVCREEELASQVLAIECIVALGTKDPERMESFIRHSMADTTQLNAMFTEAADGRG